MRYLRSINEKVKGDMISSREPFKFQTLDDQNAISLTKKELAELIQDSASGEFNSGTSQRVLNFLGSSKFM